MAYALVVLVYLAVNFLFAALMNSIAIKKGYENSHAFALVFFFGVLGMLYVIALPDMKVTLILSFIALSVLGMGTSETALGVQRFPFALPPKPPPPAALLSLPLQGSYPQEDSSALLLKFACRFHHVPNTHETCMKDVCPLFLLL